MQIFDSLVLIHADLWAIKQKKSSDQEILFYQNNISNLVKKYLDSGKNVYFSRVCNNEKEIEYLDEFMDEIIWIPHKNNVKVKQQAEILKQEFFNNNEFLIEFAGGFEFACFRDTIRNILGVESDLLKHEKQNINGGEYLKYFSNKTTKIQCFANKKNIF